MEFGTCFMERVIDYEHWTRTICFIICMFWKDQFNQSIMAEQQRASGSRTIQIWIDENGNP